MGKTLKVVLFFIVLILPSRVLGAYASSGTIVINAAQVGSGGQTNFPVLFLQTDSNFKTIGNGGKIQNTVTFNGQTVPADLIFTSDSAGMTLLSWEVASYSATTGAIEVWIKEPTLSASVNTTIYVFAGNASVSTYQGGSVGAAWDSNFVGVYHLANGSSLSTNDSTTNGYNGTNHSATAVSSGQIDGAGGFNGSSQYISLGNPGGMQVSAITVSGWINITSASSYNSVWQQENGNGWNVQMATDSSRKMDAYVYTQTANSVSYFGGSHTLTAGTWYYLTLTYSSSAGLTGYVNAASDGTAAANGPVNTSQTSISGNAIGSTEVPDNYFNGSLDEIHVSSSVRSASWITTEYNNQSSPSSFYTWSGLSGGNVNRAPPVMR